MPVNSRFFSDEYTSYYLTSFKQLYAFNPKNHHRARDLTMPNSVAREYCKNWSDDLVKTTLLNAMKSANVEYVVVKLNTTIYLQSTSCFYQKGMQLLQALDNDGEELYRSDSYVLMRLY